MTELDIPRRAPLARQLAAEATGSFMLFATVVGSGIMAERLSGENMGVALLANTIATGAMLFVLITMLGPISGAQMNPAVSLVAALRGDITWSEAARSYLYRSLQASLVCGSRTRCSGHRSWSYPPRRALELANGRASSSPPSD